MKKPLLIAVVAAGALLLLAQTVVVDFGGPTLTVNRLPLSTVTFALSDAQAVEGFATLDLSITTTRRPPASLQFDLNYPSQVTSVTVQAAGAALAAGKDVQCSDLQLGIKRCLIFGLNEAPIQNGVVAQLGVMLEQAALLTLSGAVASTPSGTALDVAVSSTGGQIGVPVVVESVSCQIPVYDTNLPPNTVNIEPGEVVSCMLSLSAPAPTGGYEVIPAGGTGLTITDPSVAAGEQARSFTITGQ